MARRAFFSFHYERDIWRANVVRNSWVTQGDREAAGFWDASLWEEAKKKGDYAIKQMIDNALYNTSVTVVLIGAETASRKYVQYEIEQSFERGKGLLGIYINQIGDRNGNTDYVGNNPFNYFKDDYGNSFSTLFHTYYWFRDDGYKNIGSWIRKAAEDAGR
jgi:hypothetical protein